ncbi:uncharacterized protein LOC111892634 [Lactuca sativa]|uniref:uncharacterized protein LOC111892634 n=1 Tax=Lactuca sativa TaxID=4236 RepID=UPI000CD8567F|nr:uncharacterized protein LOC111892634 [Lactuca sativa]
MSITAEVNHHGVFLPNPLTYDGGICTTVTDINFDNMEYPDLMKYLVKLTPGLVKKVYYCISNQSLARGLRFLMCDVDFKQCLADGHENGGRIVLYIEHHDEDIMDWIAEELSEDVIIEDDEDEDTEYEENDEPLLDDISFEHESDDEKISTKTIHEDEFLNKLCGNTNVTEHRPDGQLFPIHDPTLEWKRMVPICGMRFQDKEELKELLTNYSVANGFDLRYEINDKERVLVRCGKPKKNEQECPFRLWASWMSNERTLQIKSLETNHTCARIFHGGSLVTYKWIAKHFTKEILEDPTISTRKMQADIETNFNLKASTGQCKRAKRFALEEIEGCLEDHYAKLWSYAAELKRSNPGSTIKLDVNAMPDGKNYFNRFYVCFKSVRDGWIEGCRRVINLDGCFLKGVCRGELLSAIGRDANNHMYPITWAVCSVENKDTWKWFMELLMEDIGMVVGGGNGLTIISDQHKGLMEAVKEVLPQCEHRQCARHIYANFYKRFKGVFFKKAFWNAASSTTEDSFAFFMNRIKEVSVDAYNFLVKKTPKHGVKHFFRWTRLVMPMKMVCQKVLTVQLYIVVLGQSLQCWKKLDCLLCRGLTH